MEIGMIGLGRMGANMARRLKNGGHKVVVYDRSFESAEKLAKEGMTAARTLEELVKTLPAPRAVWVMVPAGAPTQETVDALGALLSSGDAIIDGGNSHFTDDIKRSKALAGKGIKYLDAGTSGGVWGVERGYCLMIGGDKASVERLTPIFRTLAPGRGDIERTPGRDGVHSSAEEGFLYCGPSGAGHFVKMVHNGIEYGLMQAYAEGFDVLRNASSQKLPAERRYDLPIGDIAELWRRGSVVSSWLLDLTAMALVEHPGLENYTGFVEDSGEGRWTVEAAIDEDVPVEVLSASLYARFRSRKEHTFAEKLLSAMREKFGGHVEKAAGG